MLNIKPGNRSEAHEDLPVFVISLLVNNGAGVYYLQSNGVVVNESQAIVFDNSGQRWISGFKLTADAAVPPTKALSVAPCISVDDGATYTPLGDLSVALSGARRGAVFLPRNALISVPDNALLIYRLTLSKTYKGFLTSTLYLY